MPPWLNLDLLPNSMLSLETEEEARCEVLDILHTVMVVRTNIVLQVSCNDDDRYNKLLLPKLSLSEEVCWLDGGWMNYYLTVKPQEINPVKSPIFAVKCNQI